MCGINGYYNHHKKSIEPELIQAAGTRQVHRGPDSQHMYHDAGIALANQRLAIIDVEHGQQPFFSNDRNLVVVQNGEIYNHIELREELTKAGHLFKTHSDTEVILRAYEAYGNDFIHKLNGMFAIAIYDKKRHRLLLFRDRIGIKPLYYIQKNDSIYFGSEIKTLIPFLNDRSIHYDALFHFLSFNYIPPPLTIFKQIKQLPPGHQLLLETNKTSQHCWWRLADKLHTDDHIKVEQSSWSENFNSLLQDAVRIRMRCDVNYGAFLSGGIDSSTVCGYMQKMQTAPVKTFSIGFDDPRFDESYYADLAASRFETDHQLKKVGKDILSHWPKVIYHCDQPHGDVSFIPTLIVSELAQKEVKMVLTGDGADELFAGYEKYLDASHLLANQDTQAYFESISLLSHEEKLKLLTPHFLAKLECQNTFEFAEPTFQQAKQADPINQMLYFDTMMLLPGNNLVKPDRMGMAVSLEARTPFLDFRMVEFAFATPGNMKLKNNQTKYCYKNAVESLIGPELTHRPKQMFTVPIGEWIKADFYEKASSLLLSPSLAARNLFNQTYIATCLEQHRQGTHNHTRILRALISIEVWFRMFIDEQACESLFASSRSVELAT